MITINNRSANLRFSSFALVLCIHGAILWGIFHSLAAPVEITMARAPVMAFLIRESETVQPKAEIEKSIQSKPKPEPVHHKPIPVVKQSITQPTEYKQPVPDTAAQSEPIAEASPPVASPPTQNAVEAPPVTPPSFNAAYLDNPAPAYPMLSRRLAETGKVFLEVYVNAEGRAEKVEVKTSSGFSRLDNAALDAVRRWRFIPAKRGNQALAGWVVVPISFSLDS